MFILVTSEILGYFVKTLTASYKYSFRNSGNLQEAIQVQLYKKQKSFLNFFPFLKSTSNFEHF